MKSFLSFIFPWGADETEKHLASGKFNHDQSTHGFRYGGNMRTGRAREMARKDPDQWSDYKRRAREHRARGNKPEQSRQRLSGHRRGRGAAHMTNILSDQLKLHRAEAEAGEGNPIKGAVDVSKITKDRIFMGDSPTDGYFVSIKQNPDSSWTVKKVNGEETYTLDQKMANTLKIQSNFKYRQIKPREWDEQRERESIMVQSPKNPQQWNLKEGIPRKHAEAFYKRKQVDNAARRTKVTDVDDGRKVKTARGYVLGLFKRGINTWEVQKNGSIQLFLPSGSQRLTNKVMKDYFLLLVGELFSGNPSDKIK